MGFQGVVAVIPNGASVSHDPISTEEKATLKHELGKREGDIFLVNVSRLVHKNAVDDCIRALTFLPEHIKLLVVGGGPDEAMLKALVTELHLESRVVFTGQVDRTMTARYRAVSDIFVRPSRSEGMGNSFASAMASRLPIIATQEGGLADFIFDAKRNPDKETTAWVVDKDSPEQIAKAVTDILANPQEAANAVETCYQLVTTTYNWDHIAHEMRGRVFGSVLGV
jgi:glycosyltransferase involved in cell wall biosynthesis